jgi:hypothetical protein
MANVLCRNDREPLAGWSQQMSEILWFGKVSSSPRGRGQGWARCQHMGDTLMPTHRLHFCFLVSGPKMPVTSETHSSDISLMKVTDQKFRKIYRPDFAAQTSESDHLANEGFPNEAFAPAPPYLAIAANPPHRIDRTVWQRRQLLWIGTVTFAIQLPWSSLFQRFVGPVAVVVFEPGRGAMLLSPPAPGSRTYRFPFHHPVELFVGSIVLRMCWARKLHPYAQPRPPNAQPRKPRRPVRSKGPAIVHADNLRQPVALKKPCKHALNRSPMLGPKQPHGQPITAEQIPHRQRFAPLSIASVKPAFEIHSPNVVGTSGAGQRPVRAHAGCGPTPARRGRQVQPFEAPGYRSHARSQAPTLPQLHPQLLGSPIRMLAPPILDSFALPLLQLARHSLGSARTVVQSPLPALQKTLLPLVGRLAAHAENTTAGSHRLFLPEQHHHQTSSLPYYRSIVPRHDRRKPPVL